MITIFRKQQIMSKLGDMILTALYYIVVWAVLMAFINKVLGLW